MFECLIKNFNIMNTRNEKSSSQDGKKSASKSSGSQSGRSTDKDQKGTSTKR